MACDIIMHMHNDSFVWYYPVPTLLTSHIGTPLIYVGNVSTLPKMVL